jgi:hypothetical protein
VEEGGLGRGFRFRLRLKLRLGDVTEEAKLWVEGKVKIKVEGKVLSFYEEGTRALGFRN